MSASLGRAPGTHPMTGGSTANKPARSFEFIRQGGEQNFDICTNAVPMN